MTHFKDFLEKKELSEAKLGPEQAVKELMDLCGVIKGLEQDDFDAILELPPVKRRGLANKANEIAKVLMAL